jgi:hypothetical protein
VDRKRQLIFRNNELKDKRSQARWREMLQEQEEEQTEENAWEWESDPQEQEETGEKQVAQARNKPHAQS